MDFIVYDGTNLKVNLPDFAAWTFWNWALFGLICNAIYGFVTHAVSLPLIGTFSLSNNDSLKEAYLWHCTPEELKKEIC